MPGPLMEPDAYPCGRNKGVVDWINLEPVRAAIHVKPEAFYGHAFSLDPGDLFGRVVSLNPADPFGYAVFLSLGDPLGRVVSFNLADPFGHSVSLDPADPFGHAVCLSLADLKLQKELEYIISGPLCARTIFHCLGCGIRRSLWPLNV